jgi:hypothetical protein
LPPSNDPASDTEKVSIEAPVDVNAAEVLPSMDEQAQEEPTFEKPA